MVGNDHLVHGYRGSLVVGHSIQGWFARRSSHDVTPEALNSRGGGITRLVREMKIDSAF